MTNYIEEMMRTAGVKPNYRYFIENKIIGCPILDAYVVDKYEIRQIRFSSGFYKVWSVTKEFPDFTAEKQLEIIKLIALADYEIAIDIEERSTYLFATPNTLRGEQISTENADFAQALAQLTTELMNAGELDKTNVRRIIECN